jgi:hypothetical protein
MWDLVTPAVPPLGGLEKPVLADALVRELAHDLAFFHHKDSVGESEHCLGFHGDDEDR